MIIDSRVMHFVPLVWIYHQITEFIYYFYFDTAFDFSTSYRPRRCVFIRPFNYNTGRPTPTCIVIELQYVVDCYHWMDIHQQIRGDILPLRRPFRPPSRSTLHQYT